MDEVKPDNTILYKVKLNNTAGEALYDTGAFIGVMSYEFFSKLENKPKLLKCNRSVSGAGGGVLIPVEKCFVSVQIGSKVLRNRVIVLENLKRNYILGQVLHRDNRLGTGYSTNDRHYISLNGKMLAQSCLQLTTNPMLKPKGKIKLLPSSVSVIEVRTTGIPDPSNIYELNFSMFQLPKGVIPLDVMHHVDHEMPQTLKSSFSKH